MASVKHMIEKVKSRLSLQEIDMPEFLGVSRQNYHAWKKGGFTIPDKVYKLLKVYYEGTDEGQETMDLFDDP